MNHLHINVPDVAEAQAFFERYFGYRRVYPQSPLLFLMDANDFLLAIEPLEPNEQPTLPDWFHFGVCKFDPDWARSLHARMKADGVEFCGELQEYENAVVFFCRAPGGFQVEVRGNKPQ